MELRVKGLAVNLRLIELGKGAPKREQVGTDTGRGPGLDLANEGSRVNGKGEALATLAKRAVITDTAVTLAALAAEIL